MLIFGCLYQHRHAIQTLGADLAQHNQRLGTGMSLNQFVKSKKARNSFIATTAELRWLQPKFEKFRAGVPFTGVLLLLLRLLQTSFMALVRTQLSQATIVCCVTLVSCLLHSELAPMRRPSDNHVALLAQVLVFSWV